MASAAASTGSSLSSPVRFESPPPEFCPPPLRLRRNKSGTGSDSINYADSVTTNAQTAGSREYHARAGDPHAKAGPTSTRPQKRLSRLGSLVSKFEILEAANKTEPSSSIFFGERESKPSEKGSGEVRQSKDFGTQTELSYNHGAFCVLAEDGGSAQGNERVPELLKLFDRSSSGSMMSFARQFNAISHQTQSTPPALTTEIAVDDFDCTFLDGQDKLEPSSPTPPAVDHGSPIKDRIKHFEHLHRRSQSHATASNNASHVSVVMNGAGEPVSTVHKVVGSHHPVRNIWRRISQSLTQSLDGSHCREQYRSSYRESTTSIEYTRSPYRSVFPLLPARKSFPFIPRFVSDDAETHLFGLDGANQSTPRVLEDNIFQETSDGTTSNKSMHGHGLSRSQRPSNDSVASHHTSYSVQGGLLKRAAQQDRDKRKEQKKKDKQREREDRKRRIAQRRQNKLDETDRAVSGVSHHVQEADSRDARWGQQTASGFMIREAGLSSGDLVAPKPRRPGQVKNIVNYYKEKSTSLLRIASGGHFGTSKEDLDGDPGASMGKARHPSKEKGKGKGQAD
ncbi:hypothetical protein PFICI_02206 [Pestalotiopsis fici W106-1]|uniref:Uncharacterized protein n=1 Tax=Pestalotiopsis fici (strain W106-1 / CGMCC3.15140) TaxID=1229662 RepID=W3XG52_PESFW|nr:uncharacterized protein PFICI_02206 [Pestalotiopsis fici W106-1]ETS84181.1 hypothetical protein PFICI_02206 [Pestalotiopsis fici W106-1]